MVIFPVLWEIFPENIFFWILNWFFKLEIRKFDENICFFQIFFFENDDILSQKINHKKERNFIRREEVHSLKRALKIFHSAKIKLKPGNYTIKISNANFQEITRDLELKNNQVTYLYEALEPNSEHQDYYKSHPEDESRVQHIADFKADLERKSYTDSDPVFKVTPYSSYQAGFSIAAEKQAQTAKVKLKITLFTCSDQQIEELKTAAYKYLTNNKLDPNNYDIEVTSC